MHSITFKLNYKNAVAVSNGSLLHIRAQKPYKRFLRFDGKLID
nr:MAG TPA_asm: hypothetical protein [Caudoviricetes sp.]